MELKSLVQEDIHILRLTGRFDAYEAPAVRQWLVDTTNSPKPQIIINLSGVDFIDSTGLATLVQGMKHSREQNGDLYLTELQQTVRIIFELTRLDKAVSIFSSETEAVQAFSS